MKKELKLIIGIIICIILITLTVGFEYEKVNAVMGMIISIIALALGLIIYNKKQLSTEKLFLYIVPVIMILFLIAIPLWENADEPVHWFRIYDIIQGNFYTKTTNTGLAVAELPEAVYNYYDYNDRFDMKYSDYKDLYDKEIVEEGKVIYRDLSTAAVYHPLQYMPQVIGAFVADIFTDRPFVMMFAARIVNMLFSFGILYLAIKIIPYGKNIMLLLTCIPIATSSFASMSPDAMTISVSYLFISYILKLLHEKDKKINWKDKIILLIMGMVIALCKIVYVPLAGLILLLPKEKYNSRKEQIVTCALIMGCAIITNLLWLSFSSKYLVVYKEGNSVVQFASLLQNPIQFIQTLFYTLNTDMQYYMYSLFGYGVGADLQIVLHSLLPTIIFVLFIFYTIADQELRNKFTTYQKIIIALIILAIVGLIFTSLYIQWTPINFDTIAGVQGRYFLPILPLASMLIASSVKIKSEYEKDKLTKILGIIVLIIYVYVMLIVTTNNM